MPQQPFFIPDLVCFILVCAAFVRICQNVVSPQEALLLCFFGIIWSTTVRDNFIRPWTNTPVDAALMVLTYLALFGRRHRIEGVVTGFCAGVIFMMRPGDLLYSWPVMTALWFGLRDWREAWQRATWFISGAAPLLAVTLYFSFAIHGHLVPDSYRHAVSLIGFSVASLGVKLYTLLIDGFPLFGEPKTLITVFPVLLFILPGVVVFIREFKWRAAVVVATQVGAITYFLLYNDFWISNAFKFHGIRYWLWLVPFWCFFAYVSIRFAWRRLGYLATSLLLLAPVLACTAPRMGIRQVRWELAANTALTQPPVATYKPKDQTPFSWVCKPGTDGSCSMSIELAKPLEFDILEVRGIPSTILLYAPVWIDGQKSPNFQDHIESDAGDGQTYLIFYGRKRGKSIRLVIPAPQANDRLAISNVGLGLRHIGLALRNPFNNFHPEFR
jgi:hypothetical protein